MDDNPAFRKLSELFTRELDFTVCAEAQDGGDTLLRAQSRDLMVTDVSMITNGLEEIDA